MHPHTYIQRAHTHARMHARTHARTAHTHTHIPQLIHTPSHSPADYLFQCVVVLPTTTIRYSTSCTQLITYHLHNNLICNLRTSTAKSASHLNRYFKNTLLAAQHFHLWPCTERPVSHNHHTYSFSYEKTIKQFTRPTCILRWVGKVSLSKSNCVVCTKINHTHRNIGAYYAMKRIFVGRKYNTCQNIL